VHGGRGARQSGEELRVSLFDPIGYAEFSKDGRYRYTFKWTLG
jgi:hypothetical protein